MLYDWRNTKFYEKCISECEIIKRIQRTFNVANLALEQVHVIFGKIASQSTFQEYQTNREGRGVFLQVDIVF